MAIRFITILLVSTVVGVLLDWRFPSLDHFFQDWLRSRQTSIPSSDIAIVAIDQESIARLGPYPWPRATVAKAIDTIASLGPKAIALDVLYAGPTDPADDAALARAIQRAGNVVVAAELDESRKWILPIPEVAQTAVALGHVNVDKDARGVGRELTVNLSDSSGRTIHPLALATALAGHGSVSRSAGAVTIPIDFYRYPWPWTESFVHFVDDVMPRSSLQALLQGKYVLIGATAPSLGNRIAAGVHGEQMTGVEVLANAMNTILKSRFYSETRDLNQVLYAAASALFVLVAFWWNRRGVIVQIILLLIGVALILFLADQAMSRLVYPPLTAELAAFAVAAGLAFAWKPRSVQRTTNKSSP